MVFVYGPFDEGEHSVTVGKTEYCRPIVVTDKRENPRRIARGENRGTIYRDRMSFSLTDEEDGTISLLISSRGHYCRDRDAVNTGDILLLRRRPLTEEELAAFPRFQKWKPSPDTVSVDIMATGFGAFGDAGRLGLFHVALVNVPSGTDCALRVQRCGYPGRFVREGVSQIEYIVVCGGEVHVVEKEDITDFFGGAVPWEKVNFKDFCFLG